MTKVLGMKTWGQVKKGVVDDSGYNLGGACESCIA